jgi:molybdopterin converting factor small subunit
MSCEDIKNLLDEYITNELTESDKELVEKHLAQCDSCKAEYELLKAQKSELKELCEPLPNGFEEKLAKKIRGHRLASITAKFGAGLAAAVALVCAVSVSHTKLYNKSLENKLTAVAENAAVAGNESMTEEANEKAAIELPDEVLEKNAPEADADTKNNSTADNETSTPKVVSETSVEAVVSVVTDEADSGAEITETQDEEAADESFSMSRMARGVPSEDVTITVSADVDEVRELLSGIDEVSLIGENETELTAEVSNLSYSDLKSALADLDIVDEAIEGDSLEIESEIESDYTIKIECKKER